MRYRCVRFEKAQKYFPWFVMMPKIFPLGFILSCLKSLLILKSILLREVDIWFLTVSCVVGPLLSSNLRNKHWMNGTDDHLWKADIREKRVLWSMECEGKGENRSGFWESFVFREAAEEGDVGWREHACHPQGAAKMPHWEWVFRRPFWGWHSCSVIAHYWIFL